MADTVTVDLARVEATVEKVVVAASVHDATFGRVHGLRLQLLDDGTGVELACFDDLRASTEAALMVGELYRRNGQWKFRAIGQGWDSGLTGLAMHFGISVDEDQPPPITPATSAAPLAPAPAFNAPPAPPVPAPRMPVPVAPAMPAAAAQPGPPRRVQLTKSSGSVSLSKSDAVAGIMRVNLNWNARSTGGGGMRRLTGSGRVDLDLGCLYEYKDGSKGVVQALGNAFRDRHLLGPSPIAWLDGDDRSGSNSGGENLFIDLRQLDSIRRILVFAYIYEGIPNWAAADAVVTLYPTVGPQIEVRLDEPDHRAPMCAIALLRNVKGELSVDREVKYIRGGQDVLSRAYRWGLRWSAGRK